MRIRGALLGLLVLVAVIAAGTIAPGGAEGAKVANPGSFTATVTDGFLRIKSNSFDFDPNDPITFTGTVGSNGNVNVPTSGQNYPPIKNGDQTIRIMPAAPITGNINPLNGSANLLLKVWIKIDGVPFGGGCRIASASSPIVVDSLITGTTNPPGPNRPITGTNYNTSNGTMKVVNNNYSVPTSSDCGPGGGTVNSSLGLPSSSGNNEAQFVLRTNPILRKGITAALAVSGTNGVRPYTVDFDASGSTHAAPLRNYQWDFDGDGTFDRTTSSPTTSFTYQNAGAYNAKMRITDTDGDFAEATRLITVREPPDLTITSTHTDPFRVGSQGRYDLEVENLSSGSTNGTTTVTDTLPTGLDYVAAAGTGWSCGASAQIVTCTRSGQIAGSATAPTIAIDVDVTAAALPGGTNVANVSTPGDSDAFNNTTTDPTNVTVIDLAIEKSHAASTFRPGPDPANVYELEVTNPGSAATVSPTVVTDTLPAELAHIAATGSGWSCEAVGQEVSCTHPAPIPGGGSAAPIDLSVEATLPPGESSASVVNVASVSTAGDAFAENDSASDPTLIIDSPDLTIEKSHDGTFTAGAEGVFDLAVVNVGPRATTATTTVTDTLPEGLTYNDATGSGWDCSASGQDVTCLHADPIGPDSSAAPIELEVDVGFEAIPSVTNTATVSTPGDENPENDSSSDTATVRAIDLAIVKSHDEPFRLGREGVYRLAVSNVGDSGTVGPITVEDSLPAGLDYVDAGGAGWSCGAVAQDVTCTNGGPLAAGDSATPISLRVAVGGDAVPGVSNTATVSTLDDFNPDNDSSTDSTAIVEADAAVSIQRNGRFVGESTGTYRVSVDNVGSTPTVGDTVMTATLPAGLDLLSAEGIDWSCSESGGEVTCTRSAELGPESPAPDISLRVAIDRNAPQSVTTEVEVATPDDRNPANDTDSDTTTVGGPDLTVTSEHDDPFRVGSTDVYRLSVENLGADPTRSAATVTDTLPSGLEFVSADGPGWGCDAAAQVVTCERSAEIPADSSAPRIDLEVFVRPAAAPSVTNEVAVSTAGDRDSSNDADSDPTVVEMVDLRLQLDRDGPVTVGEEAVYQVAVDNVGTASTSGPARVLDSLPAGLTPIEAGGAGWACSIIRQDVRCEREATLDAGRQAGQLTIRADVGSATATNITNTATVTTAGDGNPANDSDSDQATVVRTPDLELSLDDQLPASGSFRVGDDGSYRVSIRNVGGAATSSPSGASIELDVGLTPLSQGGPGWTCAADGRIVDCEHATPIPAGERRDIAIEFETRPNAGKEATTSAVVNTFDDADPDNDRASRTSPISRIDLKATRGHRGDWQAGEKNEYKLGVESVGDADTVGPTTIRDSLPTGVTLSQAAGPGWSCRGSSDTLICVREASIPAGATAPPIRVIVDVGDAAVPSVRSTATVSTEDDSDDSNDSATETIRVIAEELTELPADLAMKRARPTSSGIVYVRLRCPPGAEVDCEGSVALESAKRVKTNRDGPRRRVDFGGAGYDISPGRTFPAPVRLTKRQERILQRLGRLEVTVQISPERLPPESARFMLRDR